MTTTTLIPDPLPPRFEEKQALYNAKGQKLGWVNSIRRPFAQRPDLEYAVVTLVSGGTAEFSTSELSSGTVLRKSDLKNKRIPRQTPFIIPIGSRLFDPTGLYRGAVTSVHAHPLDPLDYACGTTIGQMVTALSINNKSVTIGRRTHTPPATPATP